MIITPVKKTVKAREKEKPNITQGLIRNFVPIPDYDEVFGVIGMYSNLEWIFEDDSIPDDLSLYVVIDLMKISIDLDVVHKFVFNNSKRIILDDDHIVVEFDISEFNTDIETILMGKYSQVSEKGKKKLLEGIKEYRN